MAITYLGGGGFPYADFSESVTVPADTAILLAWGYAESSANNMTATLGGNGLTSRASTTFYYGGWSGRLMYYLNPSAGAQTLAFSGTTLAAVGWAAYGGVDTTTPFNGTTSIIATEEAAVSANISATVSSATGEVVIMAGSGQGGLVTDVVAVSGETVRVSDYNFDKGVYLLDEPGATSVTIAANDVGGDSFWSNAAFVDRLNPAAGGGGTHPRQLLNTRQIVTKARAVARW
jgi:hypothetical protein